MTQYNYRIADWKVSIHFTEENEAVGIHLLPSFTPFVYDQTYDNFTSVTDTDNTLNITVDQTLAATTDCERIKVCDTGNGDIIVDMLKDGGYQYLIKDIRGKECALMVSSPDFLHCTCRVYGSEEQRKFGLNNCMMLSYAFFGATRGTLLVHASLVRHEGAGYAFIAASGTGKSTQTSNWMKVIPNCDLMNDDNPVIRVIGGKAIIYGSPWSGKTPCYRQTSAPLGAISKISRNKDNFVTKMQPIEAFSALLTSCSVMKWDKPTYRGACDTVSAVVGCTGIYTLHCTAAPESALVCNEAIKVKG